MMTGLFKNLVFEYHNLLGTKEVEIDGVRVSLDVAKTVKRMLIAKAYEAPERHFLRRVLRPENRVLEIGCGIGVVSILARHLCSQGHVRSYEANPTLEEKIRHNYELNGLEPDLVMKAVTLSGQDFGFFVDDNIVSSSAYDRGRDASQQIIESDPFNQVMRDYKPDTIIMDIEGGEVDLLENGDLTNVKQMIVELHPHIVGSEAIDRMIATLKDKNLELVELNQKVGLFTSCE